MKTYLDWSAYDTYGIGDAYSGIPATGGNYAKAVAVCMHSHACQSTGKGVMCPSYRITDDPAHTTEARVAAFKAALNGEYGDDPFTDPRLAAAMDLCVSCKGCKKECPSAVDMTLIKTEYLAQRHARQGAPLRTKLFANVPIWTGSYAGLLRLSITLRNRFKPLAWLAEKLLGIAARMPLPSMAQRSFHLPAEGVGTGGLGDVYLFADTFSTHFEPAIAQAATEILVQAGYRVLPVRPAAGLALVLWRGRGRARRSNLSDPRHGRRSQTGRSPHPGRPASGPGGQNADHRAGAVLSVVVARRTLLHGIGGRGR